MGFTPRPIKATGSDSYQGEVANGKLDIVDGELDDDIGTLYALVNGGLSDANIAAGAAIAYSKLNLNGQIRWTDLNQADWANRIKNVHVAADAAIDPSKINFGVTPGVPPTVIIHDVDQIFPGATIQDGRNGYDETDIALGVTEAIVKEVAWTTRGGFWPAIDASPATPPT
jgi:hypothetical protein